ncbi:2'-5' RNA ligase family protein [Patescibacteria group bacterium]|nr:2'-5' RNA ligase family protein [Patescibacteria group bacterium]
MTKAEGYSIWLIPSGDVYQELAKIISQLSEKYSTPNFEPHVTLIGAGELVGTEEEMLSKTSKLTDLLRPFKIKLIKADYFDEYFRCVFIRAEKTKEITEVNNIARATFNLKLDPEYMPHFSLMYGDINPETKEKILADLGKEFDISFEVNSLHLFSTTGEVNDWHKVKEFPLS